MTLIQINLNNQRHTTNKRETTAQTMYRLRQSIATIKASGGNPEHYERALRGLRCPTCGNEGECPDCGG